MAGAPEDAAKAAYWIWRYAEKQNDNEQFYLAEQGNSPYNSISV